VIAPLVLVAVGYLVGSVPSGLVVGRLFFGIDVRRYGSGNIGATNVLRTLGLGAAALVFALDLAKGTIPVALAHWLFADPWWQVATALAAVAGHNWSIYLRFRGGRGVTTSIGALLAMTPLLTLLAVATGVAVIGLSRYVSLGSLTGAAMGLLAVAVSVTLAREPLAYLVYCVLAMLFILVQHRDNIGRLLSGKERKLGQPARPLEPT
jgi:glycerol-3-phosphate acyltransferase PlsY